MKTKLSPATVGMFILGALTLFVVGFLSFGGSNIFVKPARFLIYFSESVSGLDPGAPVKLNGVRVGRVAAINVRYDAASKEALVQVTCEVNRNILTDSTGVQVDLTNPARMQELIDRGLRARVNLTGITGLLFVELDFEDVRKYPPNPRFMAEPLPVVPAITSPIAEVQQSIVEIVANLKQVDFTGLSRQLKTLLATTNDKVSALDTKALGDKVGGAADAITAFVNSPEAKQTFLNLNAALTDLRVVLARLDGNIGPLSDEMKKTMADAQTALKSLEAAAATTQRFVASQGNLGDEVTTSLHQLSDAAAALERLSDALARNPSSLIVGKKKPGQP
ncbi:MlaD family protein [Opitutus sp. GAS368]|uniref:MlaD family protein n=1 Tax=Opitutus sp. GAS368 TaxID=1882749 RepID=UPI00087C5B49|nr:MlaD family protein [Opitutus sp. GAS368]SDR82870.1 paraquat-inducible protein B [Opitutus sp. GAS368]